MVVQSATRPKHVDVVRDWLQPDDRLQWSAWVEGWDKDTARGRTVDHGAPGRAGGATSPLMVVSGLHSLHTMVERFRQTLAQVGALRRAAPMWNSPDPRAIDQGENWLRSLFVDVLIAGLPWLAPHIAPGMEGEIEVEWWHQGRTLTIYIGPNDMRYLESWGPNMDTDMADGELAAVGNYRVLWERLLYGERGERE